MWRISNDNLHAKLMFEPDEWKAAYILNKRKLPDKQPALDEVVRLAARLGGFLAQKRDGEPGVKTIWLGMQRIPDFAAGIRFSRVRCRCQVFRYRGQGRYRGQVLHSYFSHSLFLQSDSRSHSEY